MSQSIRKACMNYFECFLSPPEKPFAAHELSKLKEEAVPILESLFSKSVNTCMKWS